jgi:hypothetical protein
MSSKDYEEQNTMNEYEQELMYSKTLKTIPTNKMLMVVKEGLKEMDDSSSS